MKTFFVLILVAAISFLLYDKYSSQLPTGKPPEKSVEKPDPRPEFIAGIDRQISSLLSPIPLQKTGAIPLIVAQQDISRIRHDILHLYPGSTAQHTAVRQATNQLCDLLQDVLTERNSYIAKINDVRRNSRVSTLVDSGPAASSWSVDQWIKRKDDALVRKEDLASRIKWWETGISQRWDVRYAQLKQPVDAKYAVFRSNLR